MTDECVLKFRFPAHPEQLKVVRQHVKDTVERASYGSEQVSELVLAVNEACMNVMQHAYKGDVTGEIVLEIFNNGKELVFSLTDFAEPVDISTIRPRDLDDLRPGGLGTFFIQQIMDECVYGHESNSRGNCLRMTKKILKK